MIEIYVAKEMFYDLEDGSYRYAPGDIYPREGHAPTAERIAYLAGADNALKRAVIEAVPIPAPKTKARKRGGKNGGT